MPALPASPTTAAPVEGDPIRSRHGSAERSRTSNRERGAYGIRTRAAAVRGRCPRPLDECAGRRKLSDRREPRANRRTTLGERGGSPPDSHICRLGSGMKRVVGNIVVVVVLAAVAVAV